MTRPIYTRGRTPMSTQTAPGVDLVIKGYIADEINLTPGERSMVAWITCDNVDLEGDVVVSSGVQYGHYLDSNPVVLAIHDMGKWPVGQCKWIKLKKNGKFNGLVAKNDFDDDADSEVVWRKVARRTIRSVSIGFLPPDDLRPGEWGPPTKEELRLRPDWAKARRIIRRCELKEYSICPIGMNQTALIVATSKGLHRPVYQGTKAMDEPTPEVDADEEEKCSCGKEKCDECSERMRKKAEDEGDDKDTDALPPDTKALAEGTDDDFDEEDESALPIKTRDHVDVKAKGFRGCGMVEKIHRKGLVDHVDEDIQGTKDDPAARVRLYKAHGDGHMPTERKVGVHLKHLTKREPFKAPSKKSVASTETKPEDSPIGEKPGPLPELICLSDHEIAQRALKQVNEIPSRIEEIIYKLVGGV